MRIVNRVLVTGAAGRLGRVTLDLLAREGIAATAFDLRDPGDLKADRVVVGDSGDAAAVRDALSGVDAVVHCAAIPAPTLGTAEQVFGGNTRGTFTVLEEAAQAGVTRAVLAGSQSAYGFAWAPRPLAPHYLPLDEAHPLLAADPYALSKQVDEQIGEMINRRYGMTVVVLRFPLLGGLAERLPVYAERYRGEPVEGARSLWAYLEDRDAATANLLALTRPLTGCHVILVAAPQTLAALPTEDLLDRFHPGVPRRIAFPGRAVPLDLSRATELLGLVPRHLCD
ncbi:NAD-dependent epimerase/dehydratase family protein [Catellatospora bangladeshensis]|uniref:NAD-dependent epimerase n=1 Tax=Catellatospora bangladeshensis TaxID=310355 RepID=A0A8J3NIP3_9ACTN|nr:NAD(P)-dependent oxidoreductase [Catellatospora bangladeshensis]GIF80621.1 NAD-dependent epimerase [Catellatospora bangladeshensis]